MSFEALRILNTYDVKDIVYGTIFTYVFLCAGAWECFLPGQDREKHPDLTFFPSL